VADDGRVSAREIGARLADVQRWAASWSRPGPFRVEYKQVGGRQFGALHEELLAGSLGARVRILGHAFQPILHPCDALLHLRDARLHLGDGIDFGQVRFELIHYSLRRHVGVGRKRRIMRLPALFCW
jgi:hypothetical protein